MGTDVEDAADFARGDPAFGFRHLRMKPVHETFQQPAPACVRGRKHFFDLGAGTGERFFAENMLARFEGAHCPLTMQSVVQGVDNDVDLGIVDERFITWMGARNVAFTGGGPGAFRIAAGDGHQNGVVDQGNCLGIFAKHPAGAQNAATEFVRLTHGGKRNGARLLVKEIVLTRLQGVVTVAWR